MTIRSWCTSIVIFANLFLISICSAQPNKNDALPSTAQPNVHVLDKQFHVPELNGLRTVRIYLPPSYHQSKKHYPVVYMHDGQNLFDETTSKYGEWKVDEQLNQLAQSHQIEMIVVGIDHGGDQVRLSELSPWENAKYGPAKGDIYANFVAKTLKPYIDTHYRTMPERDGTAIAGSSMGGLMSHYLLFKYPDIFSKAAILSPSYWYSEQVFDFTRSHIPKQPVSIYMATGDKEPAVMTNNQRDMLSLFSGSAPHKFKIQARIVSGKSHNEAFWSEEFRQAILWLSHSHKDLKRN